MGKTPKGEPKLIYDSKFFPAREKARLKVEEIISKYGYFSFDLFDENLIQPTPQEIQTEKNLWRLFELKTEELREQERFNSAVAYQCAMKSLKKFAGKEFFPIEGVTVKWLEKYEKWARVKKIGPTTIGIYSRHLRAIVNMAIETGLMDEKNYPFGKRGYTAPRSQARKMALTNEQLKPLFLYNIESDAKAFYVDMWRFSFLSNGMNINDVLRLKWSDVYPDRIIFDRQKTGKQIVVFRNEFINKIIDRHSTQYKSKDDYIFKPLNITMNEQQKCTRIQTITRKINREIKEVCHAVGIETIVSTYTARHSFATQLMKNGAPLMLISESLGHTSLKTTENYLGSFSDDVRKHYGESLLNFDK